MRQLGTIEQKNRVPKCVLVFSCVWGSVLVDLSDEAYYTRSYLHRYNTTLHYYSCANQTDQQQQKYKNYLRHSVSYCLFFLLIVKGSTSITIACRILIIDIDIIFIIRFVINVR